LGAFYDICVHDDVIEYFWIPTEKKSDTVDLLPLLISFMKMSIDGEYFICLCQSHKPQRYSKESHKVRKNEM